MKNKTYSIDAAMVTRRFYCHKCGDRLLKNARTRLLRRGDPDYRKHNMGFIGDIELTEYNFKCWTCDRIVSCDEQYVIEKCKRSLESTFFPKRRLQKTRSGRVPRLREKRKSET